MSRGKYIQGVGIPDPMVYPPLPVLTPSATGMLSCRHLQVTMRGLFREILCELKSRKMGT